MQVSGAEGRRKFPVVRVVAKVGLQSLAFCLPTERPLPAGASRPVYSTY